MFRGNRTTLPLAASAFSNSQVKSSYLKWIFLTQVKIVRVCDLPWRFIAYSSYMITHEL